MTRGCFISLEGVEGAGKSTSLDCIQRLLEAHGREVRVTREPGGTPLAEQIRVLLLAGHDEPVDPLAETLLVFAARAQHVATVIEPALRAGRWVLCDRFTDSTFAYQGGGRGVAAEALEQLAALVHGGRWPDLTLYLDMPPRAAMARLGDRDLDRFEREQPAFFERVRGVYRRRASRYQRIVEIDASRDQPLVLSDVERAVRGLLDGCRAPLG